MFGEKNKRMFGSFYKSRFEGLPRSHFWAPTIIGPYSWLWRHIVIHNWARICSYEASLATRWVCTNVWDTRKAHSHTLAQAITFQSLGGEKGHFLIYKSWKLNHRPSYWTVWKSCLNSAKNLEDIVYGSWLMVLQTVTLCESFGSLWKSVVLSQDLNSLSLVWIEYSTGVLNSFST